MIAARVARSQGDGTMLSRFRARNAGWSHASTMAFVVAETYRLMRRYEDYDHLRRK
jgi:hypothetical protein